MADPTPTQWAATVLKALGIHQTPGAVQALTGWATAEGGHWHNDAKYNPLNTTQPEPGAGNTGSQGNIKVYKSWAQGVKATVDTLTNGKYGGILSALKTGSPTAVADAIGKTPWGTSADLVKRTIASTPSVSGVHSLPVGGSGATSTPSTAVGDTTTTSGATSASPNDTQGVEALLAAMQPQAQPAQTAGLQAPSFSARPTLATGAQVPTSGGATAGPSGVDALLSAAAIVGQQDTGSAGSSPSSSSTPTSSAGGQASGAAIPVSGGQTLKTTYGGVTESVKAGALPKVARASDVKNLQGVVAFDGKPVAAWVGYALNYARQHGWKGALTEGYRTDKQQTGIYDSGVRPAAVPKSLGGGGSNHEVETYPGGAADVSEAAQLAEVLRKSPYGGLLQWAGGKDPVHFSHPHGGSY